MERQGKCWGDDTRFIWRGEPKLQDALCPYCGGPLERTNKKSLMHISYTTPHTAPNPQNERSEEMEAFVYRTNSGTMHAVKDDERTVCGVRLTSPDRFVHEVDDPFFSEPRMAVYDDVTCKRCLDSTMEHRD